MLSSVGHALSLLGDRKDAKLLAGGHSLLPLLHGSAVVEAVAAIDGTPSSPIQLKLSSTDA